MKVIKSNVLIQEIKSDSPVTKVGGFVIPDDQKEYIEAKVISVGSEVKEEVKEGDTILLSPACASWDQYNNFEERGDEFKKIVSELK